MPDFRANFKEIQLRGTGLTITFEKFTNQGFLLPAYKPARRGALFAVLL